MWKKCSRTGEATDDNRAQARWVPTATHHTHTHGIYNAHCFSTATMVIRMRLYVTFHVHCLSCFCFHSRLHGKWRGNNENSSKHVRGNSKVEQHLLVNCLHCERIWYPNFLVYYMLRSLCMNRTSVRTDYSTLLEGPPRHLLQGNCWYR